MPNGIWNRPGPTPMAPNLHCAEQASKPVSRLFGTTSLPKAWTKAPPAVKIETRLFRASPT